MTAESPTRSWGLRPSVLDDLGLQEALERLSSEVSHTRGFVVDVHTTGPRLPRLPEALETALYRVVQEALTNASKHASPKAVSVLIHRNPSEVRLLIEDDGKGFDVSETLSEAHLGLVGIRRAGSSRWRLSDRRVLSGARHYHLCQRPACGS